MRTFAVMSLAAAGYILLLGSLVGMPTVLARPTHELTAELGEITVLAVEAPASLVAGCEKITMS